MSAPQTEEYLAARIESCRLLGLNPDDLTAHEAIRADLATVLRLWLDGSQSALLSGGSADPVKLLSVVEALTKLVPEREHHSRREDPRQIMFETYMAMRRRGAAAGQGLDGLKLTVERLQAENEQLKAQLAERSDAPDEPSATAPAAPAGGNVVTLRPSPTAERSAVSSPPTAASAPVLGDLVMVVDPSPAEDWRNYVDGVYIGPGQRWWGPV